MITMGLTITLQVEVMGTVIITTKVMEAAWTGMKVMVTMDMVVNIK